MIRFDEDFALLDLSEVATKLDVNIARVKTFVQVGTMASVYHGGRCMVSLDEVERFAKAHEPAPTRSPVQLARRFRPTSRPAPQQEAG